MIGSMGKKRERGKIKKQTRHMALFGREVAVTTQKLEKNLLRMVQGTKGPWKKHLSNGGNGSRNEGKIIGQLCCRSTYVAGYQ